MAETDVGDYKKISLQDFEKLQLRVGTIVKVEQHPDIPRDYVILVDTSAADENIQVVASLTNYKMEELIGQQVIVICNLTHEDVGGKESQGMLLISYDADGKPALIGPNKKCLPGTKVAGMIDSERYHFDEGEHTHP